MVAHRSPMPRGKGTPSGLVLGGVLLLPPLEVDNTITELVAVRMGRWMVARLRDLGAVAGEVVYGASATKALVARTL